MFRVKGQIKLIWPFNPSPPRTTILPASKWEGPLGCAALGCCNTLDPHKLSVLAGDQSICIPQKTTYVKNNSNNEGLPNVRSEIYHPYLPVSNPDGLL